MSPGRRDQHGAATVLVVLLTGVLLLVGLVTGGVVAVVAAHRTAQAAADLAALGAAQALQDGGDPCVVAAHLARRNEAGLERCTVSGWEVRVSVGVDARVLPRGRARLRAEALAGPVGHEGEVGQVSTSH